VDLIRQVVFHASLELFSFCSLVLETRPTSKKKQSRTERKEESKPETWLLEVKYASYE